MGRYLIKRHDEYFDGMFCVDSIADAHIYTDLDKARRIAYKLSENTNFMEEWEVYSITDDGALCYCNYGIPAWK